MICPSCRKEIQDLSEVCPECGASITATASEPEQPVKPLAETLAESLATIDLRRASKFTATFTRMDVYIDGLKMGDLMTGERRQFELQPGPHTLYVRLDNFKSPKVSVNLVAGEVLRLVCSPKMLGWGVSVSQDKG